MLFILDQPLDFSVDEFRQAFAAFALFGQRTKDFDVFPDRITARWPTSKGVDDFWHCYYDPGYPGDQQSKSFRVHIPYRRVDEWPQILSRRCGPEHGPIAIVLPDLASRGWWTVTSIEKFC